MIKEIFFVFSRMNFQGFAAEVSLVFGVDEPHSYEKIHESFVDRFCHDNTVCDLCYQ